MSEKYSRIPESVLFDRKLSVFDRLVYAALSFRCFQGNTPSVGDRTIAANLGISRAQAQRSLAALAGRQHINVAPRNHGARAQYVLNSPVFGQKQGKETIVGTGPSGGKRLVSMDRSEVA